MFFCKKIGHNEYRMSSLYVTWLSSQLQSNTLAHDPRTDTRLPVSKPKVDLSHSQENVHWIYDIHIYWWRHITHNQSQCSCDESKFIPFFFRWSYDKSRRPLQYIQFVWPQGLQIYLCRCGALFKLANFMTHDPIAISIRTFTSLYVYRGQ